MKSGATASSRNCSSLGLDSPGGTGRSRISPEPSRTRQLVHGTLAVIFLVGSPLAAQRIEATVPIRVEGVQPAWGEHADGGEIPAGALAISFMGSAVYDIVSAPASARLHNEQFPGASRRSPRAAFLLSLTTTTVPLAIAGLSGSTSTPAIAAGYAGLLLGPSMGHWYAGRHRRALTGIGVRAGLSLATFALYECCT